MPVYFYDPPDRFVAGAVGQPGERIFYLQATSTGRVTSVVLEKFQVSLLAERIDELLDEVLRRTGGSPDVPAAAPAVLQDDAPLDLPLLEDFRVGAIALAWYHAGNTDQLWIQNQELLSGGIGGGALVVLGAALLIRDALLHGSAVVRRNAIPEE